MKMEVSFDEPLNVDLDGNELLLSDVLGTDNPDKVQEALSSWDKFNSVAEKQLPKVIRCFQVMMIHTGYFLTTYQHLGLIQITRL